MQHPVRCVSAFVPSRLRAPGQGPCGSPPSDECAVEIVFRREVRYRSFVCEEGTLQRLFSISQHRSAVVMLWDVLKFKKWERNPDEGSGKRGLKY